MMVDATSTPARRSAMPTWAVATIAGGFGLFYAYFVWNAVAFLIQQAGGTFGLSGLGWGVLVFAVAFPIIAFAAAFALGWKRDALHCALVFLTGLALTSVLWLNVLAYSATSFSLYGS